MPDSHKYKQPMAPIDEEKMDDQYPSGVDCPLCHTPQKVVKNPITDERQIIAHTVTVNQLEGYMTPRYDCLITYNCTGSGAKVGQWRYIKYNSTWPSR